MILQNYYRNIVVCLHQLNYYDTVQKRGDALDPVNQYGVKVERDAAFNGDTRVSLHEHSFYELYFLVSGKRRYLMKHTVFDVEPGNLVFIPKMQLHRATSTSQAGYDRYVLYFSELQVSRLSELIGTNTFDELVNSGCMKLPSFVSKQVQKDMEQIRQELENHSPISGAVITHLFQGIILSALRFGSKKQHLIGESADKIQMIAKYISEHYSDDITLTMAANMAYLEKTYFSKRFKALTGFGFQEYLLQTRILAAEKMLLETKLPMSKIAESCGFSCSNYFGDVFRRYKGISPSDYRKQNGTE